MCRGRSATQDTSIEARTRSQAKRVTSTTRPHGCTVPWKSIGVMRSDRQYENFILHIEWKHIEPGGNSGVFVWSDAKPGEKNRLPNGVEVQMLELDWVNLHKRNGETPPVAYVHGELFGVGVDEGQTTLRLRHAYGELGQFGAGQTWSPFMDIDVFPNSLEYWGPTGMVFFRNVQVRWMPIQGDTRLTVALERPGASGDEGLLADRIELQNVQGRFPLPDLTGEYRFGGSRGYFEVAGLLGYLKWDDLLEDQFDLSGSASVSAPIRDCSELRK